MTRCRVFSSLCIVFAVSALSHLAVVFPRHSSFFRTLFREGKLSQFFLALLTRGLRTHTGNCVSSHLPDRPFQYVLRTFFKLRICRFSLFWRFTQTVPRLRRTVHRIRTLPLSEKCCFSCYLPTSAFPVFCFRLARRGVSRRYNFLSPSKGLSGSVRGSRVQNCGLPLLR